MVESKDRYEFDSTTLRGCGRRQTAGFVDRFTQCIGHLGSDRRWEFKQSLENTESGSSTERRRERHSTVKVRFVYSAGE
jgi:hypothetical protein